MNQGLVIAVFVTRAKLQMAVQKKPDVIFEAGEHNVLIACVTGQDDFIGIILSSAAAVMRLACARPIPKPHITSTQSTRKTCAEGNCLANRNVLHSATATLIKPNSIADRTSPRCGTSRIGNSSEAPSAPR